MYRLSVFLCFFFASLVIALFTLIVSDDTFTPGSDNAAILVQDLTSLRAWVVVIGLVGFSWNAATKKPNALFVTVFTALVWVMFLEDYMVLNSVLFIANHPMAQAVIITRPVFLVALTYVAFKQWEVDLSWANKNCISNCDRQMRKLMRCLQSPIRSHFKVSEPP